MVGKCRQLTNTASQVQSTSTRDSRSRFTACGITRQQRITCSRDFSSGALQPGQLRSPLHSPRSTSSLLNDLKNLVQPLSTTILSIMPCAVSDYLRVARPCRAASTTLYLVEFSLFPCTERALILEGTQPLPFLPGIARLLRLTGTESCEESA